MVTDSAQVAQHYLRNEMAATPFASQLDDVDKALFEFRYRKQNQQYSNHNSHQHGAGNNYYHRTHQHHSNGQYRYSGASTGLNSKVYRNTTNHFNHPQVHINGGVGYSTVGSTGLNTNSHNGKRFNNSNVTVVSNNRQFENLSQPQPQYPYSQTMTASYSSGLGCRSVPLVSNPTTTVSAMSLVAGHNFGLPSSPDSFVEEILSNNNLSSSVSSSSSSTNHNNDLDVLYNPKSANRSNINDDIHRSAVINNSNANFNVNEKFLINELACSPSQGSSNNNRSGWLNIWGNDMSVWG